MNKKLGTILIIIVVIVLFVIALITGKKGKGIDTLENNDVQETINQDLDAEITVMVEESAPTGVAKPKSQTTKPSTTTVTTTTTIAATPPVEPVQPVATDNEFTLADVAKHSGEADCYSAIDGVVYDLTAWINKHPGGDRNILRICGIDGTQAYNSQHGNSSRTANILAGFEVGVLIN